MQSAQDKGAAAVEGGRRDAEGAVEGGRRAAEGAVEVAAQAAPDLGELQQFCGKLLTFGRVAGLEGLPQLAWHNRTWNSGGCAGQLSVRDQPAE